MLIRELFLKGYARIILDTNLNNTRAQHVYEKLGFHKVRIHENSWKNQLGELQSSIDYELKPDDFVDFSSDFGEKEKKMELTDKIINYLKETYQPDAIITYGSFADGSMNENSDFDALVIANHEKTHDSSIIEGTVLDVFIYPADRFQSEYDPQEFVQIWDGKIVLDKTGIAGHLQKRVLAYLEHTPQKTADEIQQEIGWCEKMVSRTVRGDAEGYYRWHWVLCDSLEIYCDVKGLRYHGPKKALRRMEQTDAEAFQIYSRALKGFERERLSEWVSYLRGEAMEMLSR